MEMLCIELNCSFFIEQMVENEKLIVRRIDADFKNQY